MHLPVIVPVRQCEHCEIMQITDEDCVPGFDEKTVNKIRKNVYWGRILKPLFYMLYACVKGTPW